MSSVATPRSGAVGNRRTSAGRSRGRFPAVLAIVGGAAGLLVTVPAMPPWLATPLLFGFLVVGLGAAVAAWLPMTRRVALLFVPTFGISAVTLYGTVAVQWRGWAPVPSLLVLSTVTIACGVARVALLSRRAPDTFVSAGIAGLPLMRWRQLATMPRILIAASIVMAALSMPFLSRAPATVFGLLFAAGPWFAIAVSTVIGAFLLAIRRGSVVDSTLALVAYITIVRLPVVLLSAVPIYSWTYKHLGVIDYIAVNGTVAHGVDIYSGWPGFFALVAWFSQLSGVSALQLAHWFPYGYHLLLALATFGLGRAFGASTRVALVVVFIAECVNWAGQDYLSPQAFAYLLAVAVLALLLCSKRTPIAAWIAIPVFMAAVVSHQLTPYWLIAIVLILGLTGHIRPRYIGVVLAVLAVAYLLLNRGALGPNPLFSNLDPVANAQSNSVGAGSAGYSFTGLTAKFSAVALWGSSALVAANSLIRKRSLRTPTVCAAVIAFSSFYLLAVQNYGGEAIYRVFLFSIPGCALLLAPVLTAAVDRTRFRLTVAALITVTVGMASLQSFYGAWFTNLVLPDSYAASVRAYRVNSPPALFLSIAPGGVGRQSAKYVEFVRQNPVFDHSLTAVPGWIGASFSNTTKVDELTGDLEGYRVPATLVVSRQMLDLSNYEGLYPPGAIERFVEQLRINPHWTTVTDTSTLHVFTLRLADD
ncbi:MAG: hypothetical protein ABI382_13535 [Nakamurella sp.]